MEEERNTYQQFKFQIALEKIEALTEQNNELLDTIDRLEDRLKNQNSEMTHNLRGSESNKFRRISEEADAAMKRFSTKLKKEISKNGKSKQGQGESV